MVLGDLGADVIKVEPPEGDMTRKLPPYFYKGEGAYFLSCNRNKKSVVLDLRTNIGRRAVSELARRSDVFVDNFRPGVLERLGLSHSELLGTNGRLVCCSITGFGPDGPYADRPAYDMIVQALGGVMSLTGETDGRPVRTGVPLGDLAAGMFAAQGILAALLERERSGKGQTVDVAMLDCQIALLSYLAAYYLLSGDEPGPQGRGHISIPTYRAFEGGDGLEFVVTANTERMWRALCEVLGMYSLVEHPDFCTNEQRNLHREQLQEILEQQFATRPAAEWIDLLQAAGVPAAPINSVGQALSDAQVAHREMVIEVEHAFGGSVRLPGNPIKLSLTPSGAATSPPPLGHDTEHVLRDVLGWTNEEISIAMAGAKHVTGLSRPV